MFRKSSRAFVAALAVFGAVSFDTERIGSRALAQLAESSLLPPGDERGDGDSAVELPLDPERDSFQLSSEPDPSLSAIPQSVSLPTAPSTSPAKKPAPIFPGAKTLPPTGPYKGLFFQNDYSFKNDPNHDYIFGEELKGLKSELFGLPASFSTGGEIRHRFMNEDNRLRPGPAVHNDYNLWRWRHFVDGKVGDVRVYAELLHADIFDNDAPPTGIDVNRWDMQNFFVDWMFLEGDLGKHTFRYGRQELLFGKQRLVSPLDWANTRRNFQGYRYLLQGDDFTFDAFAVNPVNTATALASLAINDNSFDEPEHNVWFAGTYYSYAGWENTVAEAYWLMIDTNSQVILRPDEHRHTFGGRWNRLFPQDDGAHVWDLEAEGGIQVGEERGRDVLAGFFTGVAGHTWKKATWTPRVSGLFYYGSGTTNAKGDNNTFHVLFPLAHAYWALSDNLSGQNLFDYALQLELKPTKKTAVTSAFHWFQLASSADTAYNVATAPVGKAGNGKDLGTALDLYGYYAFNPNFDVQTGYSWFWYGEYIERTAPRDDATQFYIMTSFRY